MTLEAGKEMDRKCVLDWLNKVYFSPSVSYSQYTDDEIRMFAHDALVLLKEQESGERKIANKEWLATLPKETWWDVVHEWLFHEYGMQWTDTRLAVMEWLEKEHEPITSYRNGMTWE